MFPVFESQFAFIIPAPELHAPSDVGVPASIEFAHVCGGEGGGGLGGGVLGLMCAHAWHE